MPEKATSFAALQAQLNQIIEWFESDQVDLDDAIEKYEEAAKLIKRMEDYLAAAENKIKKISLEP